jgi:mersacidin/lichenicidin family type 2 lantibiotic
MDHINISDIDVVRAWKDEEYWNSLSEEQKAQLPENPAGLIDLTDEALNGIVGGIVGPGRVPSLTADCGCPWSITGRCRCPW